MTYSASIATIRTQVKGLSAKASTQLTRVDWAQVRAVLYNIAVAVGVACYLVFLAARATVNAGKSLKRLWVKYEMGAKTAAAFSALRSEVPSLSARIVEVKRGYNLFAGQVRRTAASVKADCMNVRDEFRA
ncbi:MAG: hypothetical protein AAFP09_00975 [Cyanobacteria bacterium J06607_10]